MIHQQSVDRSKLLSLKSNLIYSQELNDLVNNRHQDTWDHLLNKAKCLTDKEIDHTTLLRLFQKSIYTDAGYLLSAFFDNLYDD
ncbi:MAG: hypothetical protein ACC656_03265, partial [Candidatus Heimdallarchaeota archaeon]